MTKAKSNRDGERAKTAEESLWVIAGKHYFPYMHTASALVLYQTRESLLNYLEKQLETIQHVWKNLLNLTSAHWLGSFHFQILLELTNTL